MNWAYVEKYFSEAEKLEVMGSYVRHAVLSQDRVYDARLSGIADETGLLYSMPRAFTTDSSYKGVFKYESNQSELWSQYDFGPLFDYFEPRLSTVCRSSKVSWISAWAETDHTKSTGFPVNQRFRTKKQWFEKGAKHVSHYYDDNGMLRRAENAMNLEEYRQFVASSGPDECISLWNVFSKNEALKNEKIRDGKLRQINGGDCRFIALTSEFDKEFNDHYIDNWRYGHSRAGMPIQHGCWDWLYRQHAHFPWSYVIDISAQDSTLPGPVQDFMHAIRLAARSKDEPDHYVRRMLHENTVRSYLCMPDGIVVRKTAGNPSGGFDTLIDATMAGDIYMMYAWHTLSKRQMTDFDKEFFFSCCGDDGWLSGDLCDPKKCPKWWTPSSIVKCLADVGIKCEVERLKTRDATFLSHKTLKFGGNYVPYPTNHHKALVNILNPPKKHIDNAPLLLGRILAQRNRFFADAQDKTVSYWQLFDALADVYRPLAAEMRAVYPSDYASAKSLDICAQSVRLLYMPRIEAAELPQGYSTALKVFEHIDDEDEGGEEGSKEGETQERQGKGSQPRQGHSGCSQGGRLSW